MAAYLKLAEIAARQNQDGQVRSTLAQAIKLDPQDPDPRLALTRYLMGRNDNPARSMRRMIFSKSIPTMLTASHCLGGSSWQQARKRRRSQHSGVWSP